MPFTVIWSAEAEIELARLHLKTRRRPDDMQVIVTKVLLLPPAK